MKAFQIKKHVQLQRYVNFRNNQGRQKMLFFEFYFFVQKVVFVYMLNLFALKSQKTNDKYLGISIT